MGRPSTFTFGEKQELWQRITEMRNDGKNCRQVAERLGLREDQVWKLSQEARVHGYPIPKIVRLPRGKNKEQIPRKVKGNLEDLLRDWDVVTIERGLNGGYMVTLDDEITTEEYPELAEAIQMARVELMR